jgi:hypothetical protein
LRDLWQTGAEFAETVVPRWANHATVHLFDDVCGGEDGIRSAAGWPIPTSTVLHRVAVAHDHGAGNPDSLWSAGDTLRLPAQSPVLNSLSNGETVHIPHADSFAADHLATQLGNPQCAAFLRGRSVLLMPLMAGQKVLGNVLLVRDRGRAAFSTDAIETLAALARWAAQCMDAGRRCDQQARLVDEMRPGLWPDQPPRLADVEVRWRYLPNSRDARIGGDWFDAIPRPDGRVALVIGDVMGHGVKGAIMMSRSKMIVRTLILLGLSPDQVLGRFDRHFAALTRLYGDDYIITCLIVIYDPATGQCQIANAGQIPPILIHPEGHSKILDIPTGAPIGVDGPAFHTGTFCTGRGSILVLCTDGFAGLHHVDIDHALTRLRNNLIDPGRPLDELCDSAFQGIDTEVRNDDVTLLLARLLSSHPPAGGTDPTIS